jgi:DNA end-binding protein Ku
MLVAPMYNGLCGVTLRFTHEVRPGEEYFSGIPEMKLPAEIVKLAQHIIETKSADFDPAMLEDHYRNALVRILRKKQSKRSALPPTVSPSRENIIDLMDALKRSIADARPAAKSISRRGALKGAAAKRAMRARRAR